MAGAAKTIRANAARGCYQGQTHGHKGFLMKASAARLAISEDKSGKLATVLRPFMIANELIGKKNPSPGRYVIDFQGLDVIAAQTFKVPFQQLESTVLPKREKAAEQEEKRNKQALAKNPKAKVKLVWTLSWFAPDKEKKAAESLKAAGASSVLVLPVEKMLA